jgi:predicted CoA-binding protein
MTPDEVLDATTHVVVIDYPSTDVPETLVRGGFLVISHDGPTDDDYNVWIIENEVVTHRPLDHVPSGADLVYTYRPLDELQGIAELAQRWGAKAIWVQPDTGHDSARGRSIAEQHGLTYVDDPDIRAAVRARSGQG